MSTYGHRHLSLFFRPVVEVREDGFRFRGEEYGWHAVASLEIHASPWKALAGYPAAIPRATVQLQNGKKIHLNGRALEKRDNRPRVGFFSSRSDAFDELVAIFKEHVASEKT